MHLILSKIQTNEFSRKIITKPYLNIYSVIALFIVDFFHDLLTGQQLITIFIQLSFLKKKNPERKWVDKERDKNTQNTITCLYYL